MPDLLTGEQEREVHESIKALNDAIALLNPDTQAVGIQSLQQAIESLERVMDEELPTPELCPRCNPLPKFCPRSGHLLDSENKYAVNQPAYLKLGVRA